MPNVQQRIVTLLKSFPANVDKPCAELLEELADDIQAEVIKTLGISGLLAATEAGESFSELEHAVEDIYNDHFGVQLCNLITTVPFQHKRGLPFVQRNAVVKAMLRTMLAEQAKQEIRFHGVSCAEAGQVLAGMGQCGAGKNCVNVDCQYHNPFVCG